MTSSTDASALTPEAWVERATADAEKHLGVTIATAHLMHVGRQNTIVYLRDLRGLASCVRYRTATEFWYEDCVKEPFIESLGVIDIPKVRFADDSVRPQLLIYEFVEGALLHDMDINPVVATKVGELLAGVHVPARGATSYLDFVQGRQSTESWSVTFGASLLRTALLCGYGASGVEDLLERCTDSLISTEESLVLVHNDVHFKNMIQRESGSVCLLDWDSATIAPAEKDFVKLLDWSHHNTSAVESIVKAYEKRSGHQLNSVVIELFRIFACLRQILFQTVSAERGVAPSALRQRGFFAENDEQRERISACLTRLDLPTWMHS